MTLIRKIKGEKVAVTGFLNFGTHEEARSLIEGAGGHYDAALSGATTLLVRGKANAQYKFGDIGVKLDRAHALDIPVVWSEDFEALLRRREPAPTTAGAADKRVRQAFGSDYRPADPDTAATGGDPFCVDPKRIERGTKVHRRTQNLIAATARAAGYRVTSPTAGTPQYDVGWSGHGRRVICEVKYLTVPNEAHQMRLGLGQVLDYRHAMGKRGTIVAAVLATSQAPRDAKWAELCSSLRVTLVWPQTLHTLFPG